MFLLLLALSVVLAIPHLQISDSMTPTMFNGTLEGYLKENNQTFGILNHLLNVTGISLNSTDMNVTVFAPNDAAFEALPSWIMNAAHSRPRLGKRLVSHLLSYHASPEMINETDFKSQNGTFGSAETLSGINVTLSFVNDTYFVNDAQVNQSVETLNGILYPLNRVITPLFYLNTSIYNVTFAPLEGQFSIPEE